MVALETVQLLHYHEFMVTMARTPGWKVAIYGNEHGIPHFHIEGAGYRASLAIEDLTVIVGSVPRGVLKEVRHWASERQSELLAEWYRLNPR